MIMRTIGPLPKRYTSSDFPSMDVPMENISPSGESGVEVSVGVNVIVGISGANGRVGVKKVAVAVGEGVLVCRNGRENGDKDGAGFLANRTNNKVRLVTSAEKIKKPMASRVAFLRIKE